MNYGIRGPHSFESPTPELAALRRERDPELRGEALLAAAAASSRRGQAELAASLYVELSRSAEFSASIRQRAGVRLATLSGEAPLGERAEILASRFFQEVTDPASLLAMGLAGAAFRATRFLVLGRLAANPSANRLTRGLGARLLSSLAGFGMEGAVFPVAGRLGQLALGRELDWSGAALRRELVSSFLMLGALRAGGTAAGTLANRTSLLRPLVQQAGMFGGIVLGHELETISGLRQRVGGATLLIDSLATLLQFHAAGNLSRSLLGRGWRSWESTLEARTAALEIRTWDRPAFSFLPEPLLAGTSVRGRHPIEALGMEPLFMTKSGDGESGRPKAPPSTVVSLDDFRRRRNEERLRNEAAGRAAHDSPHRRSNSDTAPRPESGDASPELWRAELAQAIRNWMPEDVAAANNEHSTIEMRLAVHPPAFRDMIAYLATHHPLAAQLMLLRYDLVGENSAIRRNPMLRSSRWITDFYSHEDLADHYERIWLRYTANLRYDEGGFSLYDVPLSSPDSFRKFTSTHPALIAVLIHGDIPGEVFMPLLQSLQIFPAPRSVE